jgi:TatD DNase family protein
MSETKNINLVDSHAHLDMPEFDGDREQVLFRAEKKGVNWVLCPADVCSKESIEKSLDFQKKHQNIYLASGVHPHQASQLNSKHLETISRLSENKKIIAIGEVGLDLHYNFSSPEKQMEAFRTQLELASELKLPVIIHSRLAAEKIIEAIRDTNFSQKGILHCFTESWNLARAMIDNGFLVSFSGILTYSSAEDIRETAQKLPLKNILVETDSPYLTPFPEKRSYKRNEPAFVLSTAMKLAELKKVPLEELAEATTANFFNFFGLKR